MEIRLRGEDGSMRFFKILRKTTMGKDINRYAASTAIDVSKLRLHFNGSRIQRHETAQDLDLQDDDLIDVRVT